MMNPQIHSAMITPRMMYSYDRGTNKSWNMQEYKTPKIYQDPKLEVQKRLWASQKKGQKSDKYVTKKGFYMDYHLKVSKSVPASSKHGSQEPWSFKKQIQMSKNIKIDKDLKKNTYLQQIENEQTKRKKPGVSTYSLEKSLLEKMQTIEKLKKRVMKQGQKRYFYENTEDLSSSVPGAGNYSPHDQIARWKKTRHDYKYWVEKHKKQNNKVRKRDLIKPTANTYKPLHQSFKSFDWTSRMKETSPRNSLEKKNSFGSDSRFEYTRPQKKKIKEIRPSPASYDLSIFWKGKNETKKRDWSETIWKGSLSKSTIYNS